MDRVDRGWMQSGTRKPWHVGISLPNPVGCDNELYGDLRGRVLGFGKQVNSFDKLKRRRR